MDFLSIIWIIFIISAFLPMIHQRRIEAARLHLIKTFEKRRNSRLVTLIHRQEALSFLGIPLSRYINIEDSEQILRAIRLTPDDMPIDLVLHTPGGLVLAAEQIAHAILKHPAKVTVYVPHYAMSGGTLIALAADEIVMDENAVLGPVDPQLGEYPAASIIKVIEEKDKNKIDDRTLILGDIARKAMNQVRESLVELLAEKMERQRAEELATVFSEGRWTHDYPIGVDQLIKMGLPVKTGLPREIYQLMELYPQPASRRPSVQYVPLPYSRRDGQRD
ncbi:SDH family Clp fold serine proteinase [Neomoorella thermoacetica]|uniref:Serine dehydrogenase proteinase n=1 Tax=Neomoorella thermoacetica TaxID=1525 RepID=A0A1D7XCA5_NEOTH|nr:ATP-dependent Clp protease proteolytic subunit [Moorella thermoacetica]AOQ24528.1 Serine dehydrogenase proteinase [Moorella thermoacetica]APC08986.1 serine dehydrogenase proteinase [Moorella thermoacetica]OIQ09486.1 serine dehydrogenase proteinase [Moorella thermoacetica]OIQ11831.1 serine dehydrogenase proteinase [Moorella thermoacetica]OIQ55066.1 serine dehydrogenase proteinase [Moorella thermoacetica]